jgi:hypothetical protein
MKTEIVMIALGVCVVLLVIGASKYWKLQQKYDKLDFRYRSLDSYKQDLEKDLQFCRDNQAKGVSPESTAKK